MSQTRRLRVLVLADQCNPEWPSLPIVAYKYLRALAEHCDVTAVTQIRNRANIEKAESGSSHHIDFVFIDTEYIARPLHKIARLLRGGSEGAWTTGVAMAYLPYVEFERQVWKRFKGDLTAGEFDIVHRISPMSPAMPSYMAGRCPQPFVLGPINGNLAWPDAFLDARRREREHLTKLRGAYKVLPYARRTWRHADRVLAAFQHTIDDLKAVPPERIVMMPEVGYDEAIFYPPTSLDELGAKGERALTFLFVGRLVPYKLAEVVVRAFTESMVLRQHTLRIVGDGPEMARLQSLVADAGANHRVRFEGRVDQAMVAEAMRSSDVFVFPSIRELGAGVVVEAMACGLLPLVVDYGAPGTLVADDRGVRVPMSDIDGLVAAFRLEMERLAEHAHDDRQLDMRRSGIDYAVTNYRWAKKAEQTCSIYAELLK